MPDLPLWKDIVDQNELVENGLFILYRHRLNLLSFDGNIATVSENYASQTPDYIQDESPIAYGYSAFLIYGLPGVISLFEFIVKYGSLPKVDFNEQYYSYCVQLHSKKNEWNLLLNTHVDIFWEEFLHDHYRQEVEYFKRSQIFFNETINDTDNQIKVNLNAYTVNYLQFLQDKLGPELLKNTPDLTALKRSKTNKYILKDIWKGTDSELNDTLFKLTTEIYDTNEIPFVTFAEKEYHWNLSITKSKTYLSRFIYTCLLNKWILDSYTAPEYKKFIQDIFDITVDSTPYKAAYALAMRAKETNDEYLEPFKTYKTVEENSH